MVEQGVSVERCAFSGSSAGSIAACLLVCGCDMRAVLEHAIATGADRFACRTEAATHLEGMLRSTLELFLPEDAAARCSNGHLNVFMYRVGSGHYFKSEFASRGQLIESVLASAHLPFYSNGSFSFRIGGDAHVDSECYVAGERSAVMTCRVNARSRVLIDYHDDAKMPGDAVWYRAGTPDMWRARFERGKEFALERRHLLPCAPRQTQ